MRLPITALAGLFLSSLLVGCGASATIPAPPAKDTGGPPPGTSADMTTIKKSNAGAMGNPAGGPMTKGAAKKK